MADEFQIRPKRLGRELRKLIKEREDVLPRTIEHWLREDNERWIEAVSRRRLRGQLVLNGRKAPGKALASRSGELRRSLFTRVIRHGDGFMSIKGTTSPYGRIHEKGGVIKPKRSKFLARPIGEALDLSGRPRAGYDSPRQQSDLRFVPSRRGAVVGYLVRTTGNRTQLLFELRTQTRIEPRLHLTQTFQDQADIRQKRLARLVTRALRTGKPPGGASS